MIGGFRDAEDAPSISGDFADNEIPEQSGAYAPFDARTKWGKCIHPIMS